MGCKGLIVKILLIGTLLAIVYYGTISLIAITAVDAVKKEAEGCGGIAKCSGKAIGGFIKDFKEGLEDSK